MSTLPDIARATVLRHDLLPEGAVVLAMVSGGADSVALLRLLAAGELGEVADLSVLHVNHGLRGDHAARDEAFVVALCETLGVSCEVVRADVGTYAAAEGLNLEDAGRRIRYRFAEALLDARCAGAGIPSARGRIVVAHTFDDRLETFLARLVTGAGGGGLRSIAAARGRVVRPLLDARRADVTAYLAELGQDWVEDATNADTSRQRAWVRHELLPLVERRNPAFEAVVARTMSILAEEDDLLGEMASAFAHDFTYVEGGALVIDRAAMGTLSHAMARRTLRQALIDIFPEASRLEFEHTEALVDGLAKEAFVRDLPFGLRVVTEYDKIRVSRTRDDEPSVVPGLLALPGAADLGSAGIVEVREVPVGEIATGPYRVSIDADAVTWPLVVDSMREGDRMRPLGMTGTRKVSDILTDAKVPRRLRAAVPILRDGRRIVWVGGARLAHEVHVTQATVRVAELEWHRPDTDGAPEDDGEEGA